MEIINKPIEDLIPYINNPRNNDAAVDKVAGSIAEFGFKVPLVIDKDNVIVTGHTRLKAAKKIGLTEVPCVIADDLTDAQIKAFRLADNKVSEFAEWDSEKLDLELADISDIDMQLFGFSPETFDAADAVDDAFDIEDHIEDEDAVNVELGQMFRLGNHVLMCGDSTKVEDVERLMRGVEADLVYTDPPYNVDISNTQGKKIANDNLSDDEFASFIAKAFTCLEKILRPGGSFYIWHASKTQAVFEYALNLANLAVREQLIWVKNTFNLGRQDYQWRHEPCFYGWKEGARHYFVNQRNISTVFDSNLFPEDEGQIDVRTLSKDELVDICNLFTGSDGTILYAKKPTHNDKHPTMKPLDLVGRMIKNSTHKGDIVCDLFGGSGSTLMACEQIGRVCYTMEYDPRYVDVIIKRWEEYTGKKAEVIEQ